MRIKFIRSREYNADLSDVAADVLRRALAAGVDQGAEMIADIMAVREFAAADRALRSYADDFDQKVAMAKIGWNFNGTVD